VQCCRLRPVHLLQRQATASMLSASELLLAQSSLVALLRQPRQLGALHV
jgi:hypothetical protein